MGEITYKENAKKRRKKRIIIIAAVVAAVLLLLVGTGLLCTVRTVEVTGNERYTASQIEAFVLSSKWDYSTIYLLYKTHYGTVDVPVYLDAVEIEIVSYDTVRIHAYEKEIIGCVSYGGNYVYFDKDGIVLEITEAYEEGIFLVEGLTFENALLYETLSVSDTRVFASLANLVQLLQKNALTPDTISVSADSEFDLTFGEVVVQLGKDESMDNKIARLTAILPSLEGRAGELDMTDVDESTERITFTKQKTEAEIEAEAQAAEEAAAEAEAEAQASEEAAEAAEAQAEYEAAYQQAVWDAEWAEENGEEYDWDAFYEEWGDGTGE